MWKRKLCVSLCCSSDEDMQSLASLMSMKQADIGNLDDFEEENEEDEENKVNQEEKAAKITGETRRCETHYRVAEILCLQMSSLRLFCVPNDPADRWTEPLPPASVQTSALLPSI